MNEKFENIGFVNFETLFNNEDERNISFLTKIYDQPELLKEKILAISKGILDNYKFISGKRILIKPNWVFQNHNVNDDICLRTNDSLIIALVEILLINRPLKIIIGDAPIQGCIWDKMQNKVFTKKIQDLSYSNSIPIIIQDFRRVTFNPDKNNPIKELNSISEYVIFDLAQDSLLDPISSKRNNFRVTSYNPDRLALSHLKGKHKYCITKELFDADLVISMPKIKTHQKTGITGALKNLVGVNGDKDFLPHHRVGGKEHGGDCYPGKNLLRRTSEFFLDCANRHQGERIYYIWFYFSLIIWKLSFPKDVHQIAAGWYGNDTTWRMVMDLNKIAMYGNVDGTISKEPKRHIYSLCDGIIGGQGDGPLNPQPLSLGVISFTNNSFLNDICMGVLMNFNIQKIPLLKKAKEIISNENLIISLKDEIITINDLTKLSIFTTPPPGWVDYLRII